MAQAGTVHIRGWREVASALNRIERGCYKTALGGMLKAAEPVRRDWAGRVARYRGASTGTIVPKMTTKSVLVVQSARKVTGRRSDFGSLQMRLGLSALMEREDETRAEVEKALDDLIGDEF
jgi:hypothetical protein